MLSDFSLSLPPYDYAVTFRDDCENRKREREREREGRGAHRDTKNDRLGEMMDVFSGCSLLRRPEANAPDAPFNSKSETCLN